MTTQTVDTTQTLRATLADHDPELYHTSPEYRAAVETLARTLPRFLDLLADDARHAAAARALGAQQLARYPGPPVATPTADPHVDDLVLARTAITPGRRYWTCARFGHSIDPRDFVHTAGPCGDDPTPTPDTGADS